MLRGPQQIAAAVGPKNKKPARWFNDGRGISPNMTAAPWAWRDIVSAALINPRPVDLVTRQALTDNGATFVISKEGKAIRASTISTSASIVLPEADFEDYSSEVTLALRAAVPAASAADSQHGFNRGTSTPGSLALFTQISGGLTAQVRVNSGTARLAVTSNTSARAIQSMVITYSAPNLRLYEGGVQTAIESTGGSLDSGAGDIHIGNHATVDRGWKAPILFYALYKRAWTAREVRAWSRDPYAMLRPAGF